jgi:hypothetical protein
MKLLNATNLDRKSGIRGPKTMGEAQPQLFVPDPTSVHRTEPSNFVPDPTQPHSPLDGRVVHVLTS